MFQRKDNFGSSDKGFTSIGSDVERVGGTGFPDPLFIIVVFGDNGNFTSGKESRIKSDTKLTNKIERSSFDSFDKVGSSRFSDGTEIIDKVLFGHTDTGVLNREGFGFIVVFDSDGEFLKVSEGGGIGNRKESHFIEGIRSIRNHFS